MAYLDHFSAEQRDLLIRLPYRAGLWISSSDTTGGDESEAAERQALAAIVRGFTEDFLKSEFVEEIMRATVQHMDEWDQWAANPENVPEEVRRGIEIAALYIDYKQMHALKQSLNDVAMTVAMAYREFDETTPFAAQMRIYSKYWLEYARSYVKKTRPPIMDHYLNISAAEHKALDALNAALRLPVQEGLAPFEDEEAA